MSREDVQCLLDKACAAHPLPEGSLVFGVALVWFHTANLRINFITGKYYWKDFLEL